MTCENVMTACHDKGPQKMLRRSPGEGDMRGPEWKSLGEVLRINVRGGPLTRSQERYSRCRRIAYLAGTLASMPNRLWVRDPCFFLLPLFFSLYPPSFSLVFSLFLSLSPSFSLVFSLFLSLFPLLSLFVFLSLSLFFLSLSLSLSLSPSFPSRSVPVSLSLSLCLSSSPFLFSPCSSAVRCCRPAQRVPTLRRLGSGAGLLAAASAHH